MGQLDKYKESIDFIIKEFGFIEGASLYELVAKITDEYKQLKLEKELGINDKVKEEKETCPKTPEKKTQLKSKKSKSQPKSKK